MKRDRRIVSLWFPRLATDRLRRARHADLPPASSPLAVCVDIGGRQVLGAVDAAAGRAGLAPGLTLAEALARRSGLTTVPADPVADLRVLGALARWGWRFTPLSGPCGTDGLWLDVTGGAHLFGGERAVLDDMRTRLARMGFAVRGALAGTAGAAWALARFGDDGTVAAPDGERMALRDLPMAALRIDGETLAGLARVGLRRVGDLSGIARASLATRFGRDLLRRLDQAMGEEAEALDFLAPVRPWRERHAFPEPVGHVPAIAHALDGLLRRLCARLAEADKGCRVLDLTCRRVDGACPSVRIGTVRPSRDADALARLFAGRLETIDAGFGIEALDLTAAVVEALPPEQAKASAVRPEQRSTIGLAGLADRLANRLGADRVWRSMAVDSHQPERAWRPVGFGTPAGGWAHVVVDPPRPLRLIDPPAPLAALGPPLGGRAGDPPGLLGLGPVRHRVARAEGPERIAPEWWRSGTPWTRVTRDYWRIEADDGRRLWVFRDVRADRWFLHGLFG